ncbi:MAG: DUF2007 domain-containing protein [Pigmentiphaga sp.]
MIPLYAPRDTAEAAVIASLLEAYGVRFFIQGQAFGSLYPGPLSNSLNAQMVMVDEAQVELARDLLAEFMVDADDAEPAADDVE